MAFDRQSLHITCDGVIGTGGSAEEIFSFGFRATGLVGFDAVGALAGLDVGAIGDLIGIYFGSAALKLHQDAVLTRIKVAPIGVDGHYLADSAEAQPGPPAVGGADATVRHPNQIAVCVSLRTAVQLGRGTKGRFYLPLPSDAITAGGKGSSGTSISRAGATADMLTALNTLLEDGTGDSANVAIMSFVGAGVTHGVTTVRVGTVLDTIRSRRNALDETYSASVLVT